MAGNGGSGNGKAELGSGQGDGADNGNGGIGNSGVLVFGSAEGPSFAKQVRPKYPRLAVARREQGTVKLMINLDEKGRLLNVKVVESAGPRLDEAALEAAKASAYLPAIQAGKNIECRAIILMRFALNG